MIGEVAIKVAEITAKTVETAAKETGKATVDIAKRIDISKTFTEKKIKKVDINKRIPVDGVEKIKEISTKDIKEIAKNYINDLKEKSICPDTIKEASLDVSNFDRLSKEKVSELREAFDDNKPKLRKEWEQLNNREWPRYEQDVYNSNGIKIRNAGDCYDAHHIQPLSMGGANEASNLTPLDMSKHSEIHSKTGSCTKLVEKFEGAI